MSGRGGRTKEDRSLQFGFGRKLIHHILECCAKHQLNSRQGLTRQPARSCAHCLRVFFSVTDFPKWPYIPIPVGPIPRVGWRLQTWSKGSGRVPHPIVFYLPIPVASEGKVLRSALLTSTVLGCRRGLGLALCPPFSSVRSCLPKDFLVSVHGRFRLGLRSLFSGALGPLLQQKPVERF